MKPKDVFNKVYKALDEPDGERPDKEMRTLSDEENWTPYALEPMRRAVQRRRRMMALALGAALLVGYVAITASTMDSQMDISANGQQGTIDIQGREEVEQKPVTVSVSPGRITQADPEPVDESPGVQRSEAPVYQPDVYNWGAILMGYAPLLVLAALVRYFIRPRGGKRNEVNYGIYKGTMPLEMHTASHSHLVVTGRYTPRSIFGKDREDYVPRERYVPLVPVAELEHLPPEDQRETG